MNRAMSDKSFVYAPQTYSKVGVYGIIGVIAFILMLAALYAPEIKVIGGSTGLDYNLVP